jgi:hypothetical protein
VAALCLAFFLQGFFSIRLKSPSNDESLHIMAGASYISTGSIAINPQHPPLLKELAGLSMALKGMHWRNPQNFPLTELPSGWEWTAANQYLGALGVSRTLFWARLPLLVLCSLTGLVVFWWGRELAGTAAGLCAAFLWAADPTMVSHSYFVTTDAGVTALSLLFLLCLERYFQKPGSGRAAVAGVTLGLALCAKFSAVFLLPIGAILVAAWFWLPPSQTENKNRAPLPEKPLPSPSPLVKDLAILTLAAIVVIQICYFSITGPLQYLHGLSLVNADHRPDFQAYLDGYSQHRFTTYFAVAWLLKEPLATVFLALGGMVLTLRSRTIPRLSKLFVAAPPAVFLLACTLWAENIGIRYLMPAMPFGFIAGGIALAVLLGGSTLSRVLAGGACAWVVVAAAGIYPDHLGYFNEAACLPDHAKRIGLDGGSRCGSDWLADSNVDWGQCLPQLKAWLDKNLPGTTVHMGYFGTYPPQDYGIKFETMKFRFPAGPPPGVYVISANNVANWGRYDVFFWMRSEPDAVVAHTYSVFRYDRPH